MRSKNLWAVIVVIAGITLGLWWSRTHPKPAESRGPKPTVRIEDRKTIDFSSGQPVVKDSQDEKAIIDKAVKEMDAATKDITFAPTATPAPAPAPVTAPVTDPPKR